VLYGLGADPQPFSVDARELRHALAGHSAVLDVGLDGKSTSAILKDTQLDPVRGDILHVDLLRVDLNKPIEAQVAIHLVGGEEAPGVKEGGVLEHVTREVTVEALPTEIPEKLIADVSAMEINDTLQLSSIPVPDGVKLDADDLEEVTIATLSPPRVEEEPEPDVEEETELVGEEGEAPAEGEGEAPAEGEGDSGGGDSDEG
jgi:large subunit ribosomal protein L25